jgi:hypothetical protein
MRRSVHPMNHIVKLCVRHYTIASQLTGKLAALKRYNALEIPANFFQEAMARLREKYLNVSLDTVLHPASLAAQQAATEQTGKAARALASSNDDPIIMARGMPKVIRHQLLMADLIKQAREFVAATAEKESQEFREELEKSLVYFQLRPHLSEAFKENMSDQVIFVERGSGPSGLAKQFLDEIDRIEPRLGSRNGQWDHEAICRRTEARPRE